MKLSNTPSPSTTSPKPRTNKQNITTALQAIYKSKSKCIKTYPEFNNIT